MILQAAKEDLSAVVRMERALFGAEAWSEESVAAELLAPGHLMLVANDDVGAVVGYAAMLVVDGAADLLRIGVAPEHQRQGVASDLLHEVLRAARAEGATRILLEVSALNTPAVEFYRVHQFVTIDRRTAYYRDGSDALVMERAPLTRPETTAIRADPARNDMG